MNIHHKLKEKGLKITPQRLVVMEAIFQLNNHPSAENIIEYVKEKFPNISVATVYKVLDIFVEKGILKKVKTDKDVMRYEGYLERHHHLFCDKTHQIKDFHNKELDAIIQNYFSKYKIKDFEIKDFQLNINGVFKAS